MTERDIIRRLQDSPVPPPPKDLAARIIKDIPAEIEVHPDLAGPAHRRRFFHRQPVWLATAAAAAVALTAAVTWELRHERPTGEMLSQPRTTEVTEEKQRIESPSRPAAGESRTPRSKPGLERKRPDRTWSLLGVQDDRAPAPGAPVAEAPVEQGGEIRSTREESARTRDVATFEVAPTAVPTLGNLEKRVRTQDKGLQVNDKGGAPRYRTTVEVDRTRRQHMGSTAADANGKTALPEALAGEREAESRLAGSAAPRSRSGIDEPKEREITEELRSLAYQVPPPSPAVDVSVEARKRGTDQMRVITVPSTGGTAEPNDKPYGDVFFEHSGVNPFVDTEDDAFSTFGLDVDTGSYTVARRYLRDGNLPPREAIRVEEIINFFDYGDKAPRRGDFRLIAEGAPSVFMHGERYYTLRLAVKAREVDADDRPAAVLVFCVDVSGSMARESRLELVKNALYELLENLRRDDYVGLVIYGSTGEVLLRPTTNHDAIRSAIGRLHSGGSTNAEEGLSLAYDLLDDGEDDGRIRRVILCSDGVANVGRTGPDSILERIRRETSEGIELTTVGFGMGNYNDVLMERLADAGDGRYAYVDDITEARRIFVEELTGTLFTLGREAKAQVEFDSAVVSRWRLLGYENRDIPDELFRDPTVDAGEIGAGHTVTAVYEVKLQPDVSRSDTVATLRFRYRPAGRDNPVEMEERLRVGDLATSWEKASPSLKLASLVAEFAEVLKGTYWAKDGDLEDVLRRLQRLQSDFAGDVRVAELTGLVARTAGLQPDRAEADLR